MLDWSLLCMLQEVVSLNIGGHQLQLLNQQQNVINVDPSQAADFIQIPQYASADLFQQQSSVPTVT